MRNSQCTATLLLLLSCLPLVVPVTYGSSPQPYSPTSHSDPNGDWSNEVWAYDEDLSTYTTGIVPPPDPFQQYSGWLYLNFSTRIYMVDLALYLDFQVKANIDAWYFDGSAWHELLWGTHEGLGWRNITVIDYVESIKLRVGYSEKVALYVREVYGLGTGSKKGSGYFVLSVFVKQGATMLKDVTVTVKPLASPHGDNQNATTDQRGIATFELTYGSYLVKAYYDKKVKTMRVWLSDNQNVGFEFQAPPLDKSKLEGILIGIVVGVVSVLALLRLRR